MLATKNKILILGIGNEILTDDGIGPKLCDFLKDQYAGSSIKFEKLIVGGLEVLEFINGYDTVIFIDAIKTLRGKVGDVYLITPEHFKETLHLSNLHDTSFITALRLGKKLKFDIPDRIFIIAVEIKEDMVFSNHFTSELNEKTKSIKQKVLYHIQQLVPGFFNTKKDLQGEYIQ